MTTGRSTDAAIRLRGVRHNNLKNFDLDLPIGKLTVITGLSGSGKSSLAFDTLFAEGQRRYIETFSPYARQFFDRMDKPRVDRIEGIPPAIAIEQRNSVRSTRSTVGTMTELCDYMKVVWSHVAKLHCRQCGQPVRQEPPQLVWERSKGASGQEVLITFLLPLSEKLALADSLALVAKQGYQRLLHGSGILRVEDAGAVFGAKTPPALVVVQDRLKLVSAQRARFTEACEQAYHFGKGRLTVHALAPGSAASPLHILHSTSFSRELHCAACDLDYRPPSPALFSFNHPVGACPTCKGFGRVISIDYDLALPDRSKTLAQGVVKPWQSGMSADCQKDLMKFCRASHIATDVPFEKLSQRTQQWVIEGDAGYDPEDPEHSWPRAWYGVKGYFRWLESKAYKMHVRVLLSRYRAYTPCADCGGKRLKPEALLYRLELDEQKGNSGAAQASPIPASSSLSLADFYALPVERALPWIEQLARAFPHGDPIGLALNEARARLRYLAEVGLGYLTLDRPTRTLSGGETERVNLTTCLGTRLVDTLFVLDEPSVGLHPRDTARLVHILHQLRDTGNTVVVVEHESAIIRAADHVVDLGPGQGEKGGHVVFSGPVSELLASTESLTGQYLSGRKQIDAPPRRPIQVGQGSRLANALNSEEAAERSELKEALPPYGDRRDRRDACPTLRIANASRHNLKNLSVEIPLGRFVALTGVSGSGKTTLVRDILLPALEARLRTQHAPPLKASDRLESAEETEESLLDFDAPTWIEGWESIGQVVLVDQRALGKTPRSNPIVYIGAFEDVRELFAQSEPANRRGLNASAFSFNSGIGQCERCRGAGFEKIEMQFLSDVFIRCPECAGRRYREHILEVKLRSGVREWSIADTLEATVDDAVDFFMNFINSPAGRRVLVGLRLLQDVGLGYLRLGQPINTLSGGESQRLKLVAHLAEAGGADAGHAGDENGEAGGAPVLPLSRLASGLKAPSPQPSPPRRGEGVRPPRYGAPGAHLVRGELSSGHQAPHTLFLFDEPTTGLHFDDVRVLLQVFQRLVDAGHSILIIEHNLDVIQCADWVIDLGPEAGEGGGRLVVAGTPEQVAQCEASHTGWFLRGLFHEKRSESGKAGKPERRGTLSPAEGERDGERGPSNHLAGQPALNPPAAHEPRGGDGSSPSHRGQAVPAPTVHGPDSSPIVEAAHKPERPLSPSLSPARSGGEGARRTGAVRGCDARMASGGSFPASRDAGTRPGCITLHGAREHNLKNLALEIPRGKFVVVTGVSGSGKSTLAFDLLFAEGQRRFLDSMNAYARQFVEQLARPDVDLITGLPPTVSIEQRTTRGGGKSTVATVTEVYHFLRLLFARLGTQHCPECRLPVQAQTRDALAAGLRREVRRRGDLLLLAPVVRNRKGFHTDVVEWAAQHGYTQVRADGKLCDTAKSFRLDRFKEHDVEIVVDVLRRKAAPAARIDEALKLGHGTLFALDNRGALTIHSTERACPKCARSFTPLDPKNFSYNSAQGWCPKCRGFGELFYLPEVERGANADAIEESWWSWANEREVCPECHGARLRPESRAVRLEIPRSRLKNFAAPTIEDFSALAVAGAGAFFRRLKFKGREAAIARDVLPEIVERLNFLEKVGLGYLQLGRAVPTLSGGEGQRIRLAAQLGSNLSGVLYVLDEPTIGLHARDNEQLLAALHQLQSRGNSLVVVEHDEETMRRADYIIDLGPGAGVHGGRLVAAGTLSELLQHEGSLTGRCLRAQAEKLYPTRGERRVVRGRSAGRGKNRRPQAPDHWLTLHNAATHNLKHLTVRFPLGRFVVVTGVSGSGKSTLVRECLLPAVEAAVRKGRKPAGESRSPFELSGCESLRAVYEVDQSPIGRTPRSTPATYVGFFDDIRALFAQMPEARMRGYGAGRFSFNSAQGRCPECEGAGLIKLEMNFLPPAFVRCETCGGSRFGRETLDIEFAGKNIAQVLDLSVEEAIAFFAAQHRILRPLQALHDTGLDYVKLGQTSPTLSGGEAQRVKLVTHLLTGLKEGKDIPAAKTAPKRNLFILEEPTIGLHIADVRRLVEVLQRLVDAGHSVIVIEHNLDFIAEADWVIDLGPEGGADGGRIVAEGTPEDVARSKGSHTGRFLRQML